jgi:lysophospholipase L1-like esterase
MSRLLSASTSLPGSVAGLTSGDVDMGLLNALPVRGNRLRTANITLNQLIRITDGASTTVGSGGAYYRARVACRPGEQMIVNAPTDAGNSATYGYRYVAKDGTTILTFYAGVTALTLLTAAPAGTFYCDLGFQASTSPQAEVDIRGSDEPGLSDDLDRELTALLGKNLYEHSNVQAGKAVQFAGTTLQTLTGYNATDWFRVIPGQLLRANFSTIGSTYGWQFAGRNKRPVPGAGIVGSTTPNTDITVPVGCYWARTSYQVTAVQASRDLRITLGSAPAEVPAVQSDITEAATARPKFEGLIDLGRITANQLCKTDGTTSNVGSGVYQTSHWFPVVPGAQYTSNAQTAVGGNAIYGWHFAPVPNAPANLITGVAGVAAYDPVTVPAGCRWARCSADVTVGHAFKEWKVWRVGAARGPLAPYNWMPFGDSLHSLGPFWQRQVMDRTGINLLYQDARGGRALKHIFEMYQVAGAHNDIGDPVTGQSINGYLQSDMPQYGSGQTLDGTAAGQQINGGAKVAGVSSNFDFAPAGLTLAQTLANVDLVSFMLGANDGGLPAGTLADAPGTTSAIGWAKRACEGLLTAKPSIRLVPFIGLYAGTGGYSTDVIPDALRLYFDSIKLPYVDLNRRSGINSLTDGAGKLTFLNSDKLHLQAVGHARVSSRVAAAFIEAMR